MVCVKVIKEDGIYYTSGGKMKLVYQFSISDRTGGLFDYIYCIFFHLKERKGQ
jgi:hypothetical protein